MIPYLNASDYTYAQYQMILHKAICARARGENVKIPVRRAGTTSTCDTVEASCADCGSIMFIKSDSLKRSNRNGGPVCQECRAERRCVGRRAKKVRR